MTKQSRFLFSIPYFIWLLLFVVTPLGMIFYKSFFDINGQVTLGNYTNYFASGNYLEMTFNSVWYAFLVTLVTRLVVIQQHFSLVVQNINNYGFY